MLLTVAAERFMFLGIHEKGFTLIELIVVFAIISVVSIIGVAAFLDYSRTQTVNDAALSFATVLQTAKSRAQSQVKPSSGTCVATPQVLDGYRVTVISTQTYRMEAVFGQGACIERDETKTLPQGVSFSASGQSFLFRVLSGAVDGAGSLGTTVAVTGFSKVRVVTVYSDGRIAIN